MSNFSNLKSIWQNKNSQNTQPPPPPKVFKSKFDSQDNLPQSSSQPGNIQANKSIPQPSQGQVQLTITRQSVAELKNSLEGKIKFGLAAFLGNPQMVSTSSSSLPAKNEVSNEGTNKSQSVQEKASEERIPSYMESKLNLEKVFAQKKAPEAKTQQYLDLRKEHSQEILSPEERTDYIINRVFGNPEQEKKTQNTKTSQQGSTTFLKKQQQATNLALRGQKKQKRSLGDFDDA